jgi:prepilin-type N-terminal cleavage/methylation domain-containing protein
MRSLPRSSIVPARRVANHRGFTLVEVLVALVLGGIAAMLASSISTHVRDSLSRLNRAVVNHESDAHARDWLRDTFDFVEPYANGDGGVMGSKTRLTFFSRTWNARGGHPLGRLSVVVDSTLRIENADGEVVTLADGLVTGELDYLGSYGATATFGSYWDSRISAPLAVRIRLGRRRRDVIVVDTLLFWVGARS